MAVPEKAAIERDEVDGVSGRGGRRAQTVLLDEVFPATLNEADQRGVVGREPARQRLEGDAALLEDRSSHCGTQTSSGAVDVQLAASRGHLSIGHHDAIDSDVDDMTASHHTFDLSKAVALDLADDRSTKHRRLHLGVEAVSRPIDSSLGEQVRHVFGTSQRLDGAANPSIVAPEKVERLHQRAIHHPRVSRPDPPDLVRVNPVLEEPGAGIHGGLAGSKNGES